MKTFTHLLLASSILITLAACSREEGQAKLQPLSDAPSTSTDAGAPVVPATRPKSDNTGAIDSLTWKAGKDPFKSQNAQVVEGQLINDINKQGYVLFGPYVPFKAGRYAVSFQGNVDVLPAGKVRLDVVSQKGKVAHGGIDVSQTGSFPSFDIVVPIDVSDLEVRVQVPKQTQVSVLGYEVTATR